MPLRALEYVVAIYRDHLAGDADHDVVRRGPTTSTSRCVR
jgi:hypothetical protein